MPKRPTIWIEGSSFMCTIKYLFTSSVNCAETGHCWGLGQIRYNLCGKKIECAGCTCWVLCAPLRGGRSLDRREWGMCVRPLRCCDCEAQSARLARRASLLLGWHARCYVGVRDCAWCSPSRAACNLLSCAPVLTSIFGAFIKSLNSNI